MFTILGVRKQTLGESSPGVQHLHDVLVVITSGETREEAMESAQTFFMEAIAKKRGPYTGLAILHEGILDELKLESITTTKLSITSNTYHTSQVVR